MGGINATKHPSKSTKISAKHTDNDLEQKKLKIHSRYAFNH